MLFSARFERVNDRKAFNVTIVVLGIALVVVSIALLTAVFPGARIGRG